jgi:hypothetical protein
LQLPAVAGVFFVAAVTGYWIGGSITLIRLLLAIRLPGPILSRLKAFVLMNDFDLESESSMIFSEFEEAYLVGLVWILT